MTLRIPSEEELEARFKGCAASHGLALHRIHLQSAARKGGFAATAVLDCTCGQRWLIRVGQAEVVAVNSDILVELRKGREGQPTSPPGHPGASPRTSSRKGRTTPAS